MQSATQSFYVSLSCNVYFNAFCFYFFFIYLTSATQKSLIIWLWHRFCCCFMFMKVKLEKNFRIGCKVAELGQPAKDIHTLHQKLNFTTVVTKQLNLQISFSYAPRSKGELNQRFLTCALPPLPVPTQFQSLL